VTIRYAGLSARIIAFVWDYIILAVYLMVFFAISLGVNAVFPDALAPLFSSALSSQAVGFLLVTLPITLYFALCESSPWQATWGKRRRGLAVIGTGSKRIRFPHALARTVLKFIPWELSHFLIWQANFAGSDPPGWITAGFVLVWLLVIANAIRVWRSGTGQSFYDWMTGTYVVIA
jgi:uncharacterized RDD family membrane protein YckC